MQPLFSGNTLRGVKVLVVEDDEDSRELLSMLLSASGGEVRAASSAAEGYRAIAEFSPDVIVSDVHMPEEDGLTFMRRVRELPFDEGGLTPSVAVTAGTSPQETLDAGFHGHLAKPFDPMEFLEVVRTFVVPASEPQGAWTIRSEPAQLVVSFSGYTTGTDMATVARAIAAIVDTSAGGRRVVVDLHEVTGFEASVGSAAQQGVWRVRHKIRHATISGGSKLARLIGRTACTFLGIPVTTEE